MKLRSATYLFLGQMTISIFIFGVLLSLLIISNNMLVSELIIAVIKACMFMVGVAMTFFMVIYAGSPRFNYERD